MIVERWTRRDQVNIRETTSGSSFGDTMTGKSNREVGRALHRIYINISQTHARMLSRRAEMVGTIFDSRRCSSTLISSLHHRTHVDRLEV